MSILKLKHNLNFSIALELDKIISSFYIKNMSLMLYGPKCRPKDSETDAMKHSRQAQDK